MQVNKTMTSEFPIIQYLPLTRARATRRFLNKLNYKKYNSAINKFLKNHKSKIIFEPGRSIIGDAGILISKVIYIKETNIKNFII